MPKKVDISKIERNDVERRGENPEKAIVGEVTTRKSGNKLAADVRGISGYLFDEVILPALKSTIADFVTSAIDMIVWGGGTSVSSRSSRRTNYHQAYSQREGRRRSVKPRTRRDAMELDDIIFTHRSDAENILAQMLERIAEYEWCSVLDLYGMIGWTANYNHERYGWSSLRNVRIVKTLDGHIIDLPSPEYDN